MRPFLLYTIVLLILTIMGLSFLSHSGCGDMSQESKTSPVYKAEIDSWHAKRIKRLTSKTGWLTLAGLYWLKDGENTFGSSGENHIKFPTGRALAFIGKIFLQDERVQVEIMDGVDVHHEGKLVNSLEMLPDVSGNPTILTLDSLSWFIIKRNERFGIRLRDRDSRYLKSFEGIEMFPLDSTWRVKAKLDPLGESPDKPLFLIFADQTNGIGTYGAGRFLSVAAPDSLGYTVIDFNKAYNPPCAFTAYATCPLPPRQNVLPIEVTAGEKNYGEH